MKGMVVRKAAAFGLAQGLGLAAAPTFAIMALVTGLPAGPDMATICGSPAMPAWIGGMTPMYLLMSAFHSAAWLRLIAKRPQMPVDHPPPLT